MAVTIFWNINWNSVTPIEKKVIPIKTFVSLNYFFRRLTDYANQITNLKQDKEDELATSRELRQKIKSLIGKIDDMEHDQEAEERKHLEVRVVEMEVE